MPIRLILLFVICLTACTPRLIPAPSPTQITASTPTEAQPVLTPTQGEMPQMPPNTLPQPAGLENLIQMAKDDLAKRLSVEISQISVLDARDVVWSNSSLGCPQPGILYAEVLTSGYLILLNVNGQDYEYHAGKNSDAFLCENPLPPVPGAPGDT